MKKFLTKSALLIATAGLLFTGCSEDDVVDSSYDSDERGTCVAYTSGSKYDYSSWVVLARNYPKSSCNSLMNSGTYDEYLSYDRTCSSYSSYDNCSSTSY